MRVGGTDLGVVGVTESEDRHHNPGNIASSLHAVAVFEKFIVDSNGSSELESLADGQVREVLIDL